MAVVVGGAPAQRHGQGVGEGLLGVAAGGQTQGLDIPGHITAVTSGQGPGPAYWEKVTGLLRVNTAMSL